MKKFPYNTLEQDVHSLRNEGNILLLGDFNARTTSCHVILLSNDSNPIPFWLEEVLDLASRFRKNFEGLIENLFGIKLVKFYSLKTL